MFFIFGRSKASPESQEVPDHVLNARGVITLNTAGSELATRHMQIERPYAQLRRAWVGAVFARLFQRFAWLQSMTISLTCKLKSDGDGGQYRDIHCAVTRVQAVPGSPLPDSLRYAGGFDALSAMALLDASLAVDSHDIYVSMAEASAHGRRLVLSPDRTAIEAMLVGDRISGHEAYNAWFSEHPNSTTSAPRPVAAAAE